MDTGNISALVLAGGKGTRIGQSLPKVLNPIVGKPMIYYILDTIRKIPIHHILVVVGFRDLDVRGSIRNEDIDYVYQEEQLGTGHALKISIPELPLECSEVMVVNGDDSAFYDVFTLRGFINSHRLSKSKLSLMTMKIKDPSGLARIVRNSDNKIVGIVEGRDVSKDEEKINEINTGCYIINIDWLKRSVGLLGKSNTGEYYIPDLISIASNQKTTINSYLLPNSQEWKSVNTQNDLKEVNTEMLKKLKEKKKPTVFIFGIDNTLINTDAIKKHISQTLVPDIFGDKLTEAFWKEYEKTRSTLGFVSIPDFSDAFAQKVKIPEFAYSVRKMFYSFPFDHFVYDGVNELMDYVQEKGEIAIVSEGDLVYQPLKIKNLHFVKYIDEVFVFENKIANINKIIDIYKSWRKVVIDDKTSVLKSFKKLDPNAITIHLQQGTYGHIPQSGFTPNLEAKNIDQVRKFIQEL